MEELINYINLLNIGICILDEKGKVKFINKFFSDRGLALPYEICNQGYYYECFKFFDLISFINQSFKKDSNETTIKQGEAYYRAIYKKEKSISIINLEDITYLKNYEKAKRDFVANASHELRTPLSIIKTVLEVLQSECKELHIKNFVDKAYKASINMENLINDMITLSFVESKEYSLNLEDIDLSELIKEQVDILSYKALAKNVVFELNLPKDLHINTDRHLLIHIINNLLDNAIKYNVEGGKVMVDILKERDYISISISDTGIGIPKEDIPFIFERFYSAHKSLKQDSTGLGLAIVKHATQILKGSIEVFSEVGKGSKFIIKLPYNYKNVG